MRHILLGLALFAIGMAIAPAAPSPTPTQTQTTVQLRDDAFSPASVTIHTGDTVKFVNDDDDAHTVTATDGSFDSKGLDSHQSWSHTFTKAGTYNYFCQLHPFMKGTVIVKDAD
jgi:plastocyanin